MTIVDYKPQRRSIIYTEDAGAVDVDDLADEEAGATTDRRQHLEVTNNGRRTLVFSFIRALWEESKMFRYLYFYCWPVHV